MWRKLKILENFQSINISRQAADVKEGFQKKMETIKTKWRVKKRRRKRRRTRRGLEMSMTTVVEFSSFVGSQETEGVAL